MAYELFDLGGQQSVSKDDMIRVCKAIHKSSFVPDFDRSESEKFIEIFWKSTPNKILNQEGERFLFFSKKIFLILTKKNL